MSEERRVININPNYFKVSNNKTRKKKESPQNAATPIHMKSNKSEKKQRPSSLKRNFLNMIRVNQEKMIKERKNTPIESGLVQNNKVDNPRNDFEESVQFFNTLPKPETKTHLPPKTSPHHRTFKNVSNDSPIVLSGIDNTASSVPLNTIRANDGPPLNIIQSPPPYGVLKNGTKPTWRTWKNTTQRNDNPTKVSNKEVLPSGRQLNYESQLQNKIKELSEIEQMKTMEKQEHRQKKEKEKKKQKRTVRRTYRVGKSKVHPRISVLVGNKTLRNRTNMKKIQLKETPISEVKRYLRKQGFIKIGTTTPNEVLRQMYENVNMVCGEVQNHNPDNLLYNYFNDTEDTPVYEF